MDRGVWHAPVHGVTRVGHDLATKPTQTTATRIPRERSWRGALSLLDWMRPLQGDRKLEEVTALGLGRTCWEQGGVRAQVLQRDPCQKGERGGQAVLAQEGVKLAEEVAHRGQLNLRVLYANSSSPHYQLLQGTLCTDQPDACDTALECIDRERALQQRGVMEKYKRAKGKAQLPSPSGVFQLKAALCQCLAPHALCGLEDYSGL